MPNFTKRAIMETFLRLLDQQPLEKITVQEIITECRISRNTFYYHFGDIYALLDAILQEDVARLREGRQAGASWSESLHLVISYLQENRRRVRHVYRSLSHDLLEQHLQQATQELLLEYVEDAARGLEVSDEDIRTVACFYQALFSGMALNWLRQGMKGDPHALLDRIHRLMRGNTRRMLENAAEGDGNREGEETGAHL